MLTIYAKRIAFFLFLAGMAAGPARASIKSWQKEGDAVNFTLDIGSMTIRVCQSDLIEVKYTMLPRMQQKQSLVVNNRWGAETGFTVTESGNIVVITTQRLKILVDKGNNAITYNDLN